MVRRLPWEQAADTGNGTLPTVSSSTPSRPRRPKPVLDSSDVESTPRPSRTRSIRDTSPIHEHDPEDGHHQPRSASTPLQTPPEELMTEGWDKDDRYRMVEDEFLDIAKEFTQHLHAAEYLRLKAAARSKSSSTTADIVRPVTGEMRDATRRKLESIKRAKKQNDAVARLKKEKPKSYYGENDEDVPEPWLGTALHGLMEVPREKVTTITDVVETGADTKAAKGLSGRNGGSESGSDADEAPGKDGIWSGAFGEEPGELDEEEAETESDDDDLDAVPAAKPSITSWQRKLPVSSPPRAKTNKEIKPEPEPDLPSHRRQYPSSATRSATHTSATSTNIKKENEDVVELPRTSADIIARMAKRRELARRKREREDEDAKKADAEAKKRRAEGVIPTFL